MKSSEKLIHRLKKELKLHIPDDATIKRTYAGRNQKNAGAWLWYVHCTNPLIQIGSTDTVGGLLKAKKLTTCGSFNDIDINGD